MRLIKIGMASLDTTVGAIKSNTEKMIASARTMIENKTTVGVFNEQTIPGYPHEDLTQWRSFIAEQWQALKRFANATKEMGTTDHSTAFVVGLTVEWEDRPYNCLAVVCGGEIIGIVPKEKLPTYNVFYDGRIYSRGFPGLFAKVNGVPFGDLIFTFPFGVMGLEVCEDIWSPDGPMRRRAYSGAELIVNGSSSPFRAGVLATRREMIATRAGDNQATVVYVNQIGGQDSLIFDGGTFVNQNGRMLVEVPRWKEHVSFQVVDLDRTARLRRENTTWRTDCEEYLRTQKPVAVISVEGILDDGRFAPEAAKLPSAVMPYPIPENKSFFIPNDVPQKNAREEYLEDLMQAMIWGLKGYFEKTGAFDRIGVALSGGKDSWLTVYIAVRYALEHRFAHLVGTAAKMAAVHDFIHVFSFPTHFNSEETQSITKRTAEAFNLHFVEQSIEDAFERECKEVHQALGLSAGAPLPKLVRQNIQARIRGARMWNWANGARGMWLQTSNMSEKAVGYTTIGGDMMGAYSLIANLPKTVVIELITYLGEKHADTELGVVIRDLLATRASAELDLNQADEDDLMPFPVLDACFNLFAGEKMSPVEMYSVLRQMWTDEELRAMAPQYTKGMLKGWVKKFGRSFIGSIFKWVQTPQAVHLGTLDLDRERALQLPVVQSQEWLELEKLDALLD